MMNPRFLIVWERSFKYGKRCWTYQCLFMVFKVGRYNLCRGVEMCTWICFLALSTNKAWNPWYGSGNDQTSAQILVSKMLSSTERNQSPFERWTIPRPGQWNDEMSQKHLMVIKSKKVVKNLENTSKVQKVSLKGLPPSTCFWSPKNPYWRLPNQGKSEHQNWQ